MLLRVKYQQSCFFVAIAVSRNCGLWNQAQEKFYGECVLITTVFADGNKFQQSLKSCAKKLSVLGGFQLKNDIFRTKTDFYCMNNYGEM